MLDWLALWDIDQWGPRRDDLRALAQLAWDKSGFDFDSVTMHFPYVPDDGDEIDQDLIALLEQDRNSATT